MTSSFSFARLLARPLAFVLVGGGLLAATGCGSGGGGGGSTTLTFAPSTDLTLVSDGSAPGSGGLAAGDTAANLSLRAGLRFGLFPFLPQSATILSARLRLRQGTVVGAPYSVLGTVVVDRVDFGLALTASDFAATVLTPNIGTLSSDAALAAKELDVTAAVQSDHLANALTSDFLVRFTSSTNGNAVDEAARFEDQENALGTGATPVLVVEYR